MARLSRFLLLLTVMLAAAAVINVVSADGWIPSFGQKTNQDKVKEGTEKTLDRTKSWSEWAGDYVPYFSSKTAQETSAKVDESKDLAKDTAAGVTEGGEKKARTAADTARDYAAKGFERMTSTKDILQGSTAGFIQRWGSWAKDNVGKYYSYGPLASKAAEKASQKATDTFSDKATDTVSNLNTAADSSKDTVGKAGETLGKAGEEVLKTTNDDKEL
ncbi:hypothetical protein R1sor_007837 [Riccia sorocarpa]|uniref:Uncharacterized protein n=1 Tax=Riccia sorocarpa TaxID=122646 RepID=A0ABD3HTC3_9MARC